MSLDNAPADTPVVYCSRTRLIDEAGADIGLSKFYSKTPHFRNALVQSLAGGNTMVLNEQMRRLLMKAGADVKVGSHDWWVYLAVTAVGGRILYDSVPTVSYRMHARNVIGSNESPVAMMLRAHMLWQGRFKSWADMNVAALARIESLMTDESRKTFELFRQSRKKTLFPACGACCARASIGNRGSVTWVWWRGCSRKNLMLRRHWRRGRRVWTPDLRSGNLSR